MGILDISHKFCQDLIKKKMFGVSYTISIDKWTYCSVKQIKEEIETNPTDKGESAICPRKK